MFWLIAPLHIRLGDVLQRRLVKHSRDHDIAGRCGAHCDQAEQHAISVHTIDRHFGEAFNAIPTVRRSENLDVSALPLQNEEFRPSPVLSNANRFQTRR